MKLHGVVGSKDEARWIVFNSSALLFYRKRGNGKYAIYRVMD